MNLSLKDITESQQRIWPLMGNVRLIENKCQSTSIPISFAPMPKKLILPLSQHLETPADPIVAVGDRVLKGQLIAKAVGFVSVPIHAPTSGTVISVDLQPISHPSKIYDKCITIVPDYKECWCPLQPIKDFRALEHSKLIEHIRQSGIAGMGGAGFPTAVKLSHKSFLIHTLILNGAECEPYITADDMLMREQATSIIAGAEIFLHLLNAKRCLIGIEDNKPAAIAAIKQAIIASNNCHLISVVVFPTKYPSGGEKQIIQILTGQEVPHGKLPADLGIIVQNVGTARAVHNAVSTGKPLISRVTTITGEALKRPRNLEILFGTPITDILAGIELKDNRLNTLIMGGPMMGFIVKNFEIPVVKTINCLIAGTVEEFPPIIPAQACIRCGMCADACPVSLLPQQLYSHAKSKNFEQLKHHHLFDCIECGACSYVCPSHIPLVQYYQTAKSLIYAVEDKHIKAEHSKIRYENRQARLAKEQAKKEAKYKNNTEQLEKLKKANSEITKGQIDLVQAAIKRVQARKASTTQPVESTVSVKQKGLKMQLALVNSQLKKNQQALREAEEQGKGNLEKLKMNCKMLKKQFKILKKDYDDFLTNPVQGSLEKSDALDDQQVK